MIQFGLRLHDAEKMSLPELLPIVKGKGFSCVHLALSKALKESHKGTGKMNCSSDLLSFTWAAWIYYCLREEGKVLQIKQVKATAGQSCLLFS